MTATTTDADFRRALRVRATPTVVRAAVSTAEGVSGWWFPTTAAGDGRLRVAMGDSGVELRVRAEGDDVVWDVVDCPVEPDWVGTRMRFTADADGDSDGEGEGGTVLAFTHHGLAALPCLDVCTAGWSWYLPSLASYAETGTGAPGPRPR